MNNDSVSIRACKGQRTERMPVWIVRQAGRYLDGLIAKAAVISGGGSGLTTAFLLKKKGVVVMVFEASATTGVWTNSPMTK